MLKHQAPIREILEIMRILVTQVIPISILAGGSKMSEALVEGELVQRNMITIKLLVFEVYLIATIALQKLLA
jgi:hypothetical protein